jgi:ATP adenylyltransferase
MDQLWAPWRAAYVTAPKSPSDDDHCFICQALSRKEDRESLVLLREGSVAVFLNRFPYNNGHLLVAPQAHKARLEDLSAEDNLDLIQTIQKMTGALDALMKPDGYNIGLNLGKAAGAGLPGHLHWHIVPRWDGDTNFMPILADVKVMVQSLDALYDLLTTKLRGN